MGGKVVEQEKVKIKDILVRDLLNEKFLKSLEDKEGRFVPTAIVLYYEAGGDKKVLSVPIIISHENSKETEERIVHVNCSDEKIIDKIVKAL